MHGTIVVYTYSSDREVGVGGGGVEPVYEKMEITQWRTF